MKKLTAMIERIFSRRASPPTVTMSDVEKTRQRIAAQNMRAIRRQWVRDGNRYSW